jgi:hypothetical protein
MYRQMTEQDLDNAIIAAVYRPDDLQIYSPGMFAERFGVPTDDQWEVLQDILCFDKRSRVCAIASTPVAA